MKKTSYLPVIAIALLATLFTGCAIIELIIDLLNYEYFCDGGTPKGGTTTDRNDRHRCVSCNNPTDRLINNRCYPGVYFCENGTEKDGVPDSVAESHHCIACNKEDGYELNTNTNLCDVALTFSTQPAIDGDPSANTATVSVTASDDAQLWWGLYANDTTISDAATLISNASGNGGIQRSGGVAGITVEGGNPYSIKLSGLVANTEYDLYVAISKADTKESLLSVKLDISTNMVGFPSFTNQPDIQSDDIKQTSVDKITLTASEDADLYWVVYASPQSDLTALQLKTDAINSSGNGVDRSGSGSTVTAGNEFEITTVDGLDAKKTYYFYAAIEDSDGNLSRSAGHQFTTIGYPFVCEHGDEADGSDSNENVTRCKNCTTEGYHLEGETCALNQYSCAQGNPIAVTNENDAPSSHNAVGCADCTTAGYHLDGQTCALNQYTCAEGNAIMVTDAMDAPDSDGTVGCADCTTPGYHLDGQTCALNQYTCAHGMEAAAGTPPYNDGIGNGDEMCAIGGCDSGRWLDGANGSCTLHGTLDANNDYGVAANGVTITCDGLNVGDDFTIGTTTYTKRTAAQIKFAIALAATSCTSGESDMSSLFSGRIGFNADISHWDVSDVTNMQDMFKNASDFDKDIGSWDVSMVTDMSSMFLFTPFNQDIGGWDVSKVTNMENMFNDAGDFNQNLSQWCVKDISAPTGFANGAAIESEPDFLPKWGSETPNGCPINFTNQPAVDGTASSSTTIKLTPSKDGNLYWIVYSGSSQSFANSTALRNAVAGGMGFRRGSEQVDDEMPKNITINGLSEGTPYYFYAALEVAMDGVVTEGELSNQVMFTPTDVDDDNDGLIEIATLTELHNMRYSLDGTSYKTSATDSGSTAGVPTASDKAADYVCGSSATGTCGYELVFNLSFDTGTNGTWSESGGSYTLDSNDNASPYFVVANGGWQPIGDNLNPFDAFFEGNGNTITGLAIQRGDDEIGLFGASSGTIQNLTIDNSLVVYTDTTNNVSSGILAGVLSGATVSNVHIMATTASHLVGSSSKNRMGALAGTIASDTTISGSRSDVALIGVAESDLMGGLVGRQNDGSITSSYATGNVRGDGGLDYIGGLVGQLNAGSITASYATGEIDGQNDFDRVGGLVGHQDGGTITISYATGHAKGGNAADYVGGLVGHQNGGSIIASFAITGGADGQGATGNYVGGLVGYQDGGSITASFATGDAKSGSGINQIVGGLVGELSDGSITASYATGKAEAGNGNADYIGGLVGQQSGGTISSSYATGNAIGGSGFSDSVGELVGRKTGGLIAASYGFGTLSGGETTGINDMPNTGKTAPTTASGLVDGSYFTGLQPPFAWLYGGGNPPTLRYNDYDGGQNNYSCTNVTLSYDGSDVTLTCNTTPLPGQ